MVGDWSKKACQNASRVITTTSCADPPSTSGNGQGKHRRSCQSVMPCSLWTFCSLNNIPVSRGNMMKCVIQQVQMRLRDPSSVR